MCGIAQNYPLDGSKIGKNLAVAPKLIVVGFIKTEPINPALAANHFNKKFRL